MFSNEYDDYDLRSFTEAQPRRNIVHFVSMKRIFLGIYRNNWETYYLVRSRICGLLGTFDIENLSVSEGL